MPRRHLVLATLLTIAASSPSWATEPWNGTWVLDPVRSSAGAKDEAADAYRFTLTPDGGITWEIPSLGEVVTGKVDGKPMPIWRAKPTPGLTLAVSRGGPRTLLYTVARDGHVQGGGSMTLVDGGKAWTDLSWGGNPSDGVELVYVKKADGVASAASGTSPSPARFESAGEDRKAIETLLDTYTRAVSTKDQALFETLLLNKVIPFSDLYSALKSKGAPGGTQNYDGFRQGVFEGPAFNQRFQDVHIGQDGRLADVSLVFVNTSPSGSSWGWKTLQLLKVDGQWKIASEFYTGHPGSFQAQ